MRYTSRIAEFRESFEFLTHIAHVVFSLMRYCFSVYIPTHLPSIQFEAWVFIDQCSLYWDRFVRASEVFSLTWLVITTFDFGWKYLRNHASCLFRMFAQVGIHTYLGTVRAHLLHHGSLLLCMCFWLLGLGLVALNNYTTCRVVNSCSKSTHLPVNSTCFCNRLSGSWWLALPSQVQLYWSEAVQATRWI